DGTFTVALTIPRGYPQTRPSVLFETKVFHPNVRDDGSICHDLFSEWRQTNTLLDIASALWNLLVSYESTESHYNEEAKALLDSNADAFREQAADWVEKYA
ncbi:hypothetical protein KIPB_011057, partial [Kipferlia bialata]